jgi:hypothetical protein
MLAVRPSDALLTLGNATEQASTTPGRIYCLAGAIVNGNMDLVLICRRFRSRKSN